jgi:predicted phosphate transport protein (TIGR00153 family)
MGISRFLKIFVPQEKAFFPLFEQGSENLVKISGLLKALIQAPDEAQRKELAKGVKELELAGDKVTYQIYETLNATFITPFDREEIHDLASAIDDFADQINSTSQRIDLYRLNNFTPDFEQMADILIEAANHVNVAVKELKNLKDLSTFTNACVQISVCENRADDLYHKAISDFFENESDTKELIKKKEVLESLEKSADKADDIAKVLKTIQVKFS